MFYNPRAFIAKTSCLCSIALNKNKMSRWPFCWILSIVQRWFQERIENFLCLQIAAPNPLSGTPNFPTVSGKWRITKHRAPILSSAHYKSTPIKPVKWLLVSSYVKGSPYKMKSQPYSTQSAMKRLVARVPPFSRLEANTSFFPSGENMGNASNCWS